MKYRIYYGNGVDTIPVKDRRLYALHDEMGDQPILILLTDESYRDFLKLCELMEWY